MLALAVAGRVGALEVEVTLEAPPGPLLVVGPNGAGKSTLLRMILGVIRPARGTIRLGERVLFDAARGIDVPVEARGLGYVPQGYALFPHLTAEENVAFGVDQVRPRPAREVRRQRASELLAALGVAEVAPRRPAELSGGERQRVALARALAISPAALLLDEPLAALDAASRRAVRAFLAERLAATGLPALVVTHDVADAAASGAPVAVLEAGRIVQLGSLADLAAAPATPFVAELVSGGPTRDPDRTA